MRWRGTPVGSILSIVMLRNMETSEQQEMQPGELLKLAGAGQ